ncbi:unnamed protein product [Trichogramma brassicae]|uniref:Endoplasmic reticulum-Golgi intermediate compartment protein 3 n=1 Tax=Trichogramma brassicae TaxID=86971 RepID=A0A6H5IGH9_9HYME|nr:unnamed protein product [Trichogramma brassicae]
MANIPERLRQFDAYPKTLEDFRIKTIGGAIVTILSAIVITLLFISEAIDFVTPELKEELFVDTSRGSKLRINMDIVVSSVACDLLSLDAMDTTGEQHLHIDHNIYKRRLDLKGQPIENPKKTGAMMFQHFIKIVPTTYVKLDGSVLHTNQFSMTKLDRDVSGGIGEGGMPGIFFSYEMSPLMVKYTQTSKPFGHFLTNACAIMGGIFSVASILDGLVYASVKAIQKKIELGKIS